MDAGLESLLVKSAGETQLGGVTNTIGLKFIWDFKELENWAMDNKVKFN